MAHEIKYINVVDLRLLHRNPRAIKGDRFEKLKKSLRDNPEYFEARPCLVNTASGENVVYAGNQRLRAAMDNGLTQVPCILENLTPEQEKERTIRDNVELGEWDFDILANDWDEEKLKEWGVIKLEDFENEKEDTEPTEKAKHECPECGFEF